MASDLPCDSEPRDREVLAEASAIRQITISAQRYGSCPADRGAHARLLLIYSLRLAIHQLGVWAAAGVCLRGLERGE